MVAVDYLGHALAVQGAVDGLAQDMQSGAGLRVDEPVAFGGEG